MGFASMFEDIYEKLGVLLDTSIIIENKVVSKIKPVDLEIPEPKQTVQNVPLRGFRERVAPMLAEDGVPPYLIDYWTTWIYQCMKGVKSVDELFD